MPSFLVFSLAASLGAMGELAGHERRGSLVWPGRAALIGLMGAALGIRRDGDFSWLEALEISVAIFEAGVPLRDYHTVQTIPSATVKQPNSRPEALRAAGHRANTTITLRDYRAGPLYGVVVSGEGLAAIAAALRCPQFTLYLGRKSCPLSAPTGARLVEADTTEAALAQVRLPPWWAGAIAHTLVETDPGGETVNDMPLDRARWHHGPRRVAMRRVRIAPGAPA
ncbi:type I-E CRISPR-associated protein Cas5/CasD [Salipiger sp. 1_MG-2023]|uniref:type I-E CRISPR-associated protein Cas5/CasD n=1 Tax=Salipiger sp. 1_MG-2023 TaxID=3062665 RepID=UPI0026E23CC7|nr:type I-E CRISPR-associated protein Cas5/CasD [Salipiger sp. 1_MG-2023]MDO6587480.1 type I-E CRISPR-associated protein Cas5/CasD [Salipiger sp. 1_MG-2023]